MQQLKEILSNTKLDFSTYANLPIREDVLVMEEKGKERPLLKQWEKLIYLRKNLGNLDKYIQKNKGEKLKDWLQENNLGMKPEVIEKIGHHNDETGGITAYFLDVQNFYDEQEELYDSMEATAKLPEDLKKAIPSLQESRKEKRTNRRKVRKITLKDLKADDRGYLNIELEEEPELEQAYNADGNQTSTKPDDKKTTDNNSALTEEEKIQVKKTATNAGKVLIWIAGITIAVGVVYTVTKKEE